MNMEVSSNYSISYVSYPADKTPDEILTLRYSCYKNEGIIDSNSDNTFKDKYDLDNEAYNCCILNEGVPVSAIRISVLKGDKRHSPSYESFSDVLDPYLNDGKTIVDPTRFVVCEDAAKSIPDLHLLTLRFPLLALQYFNAEIGLGSVRRKHSGFYKRVLQGETICGERKYPGLNVELTLMLCRFSENRNDILSKYPIFQDIDNEGEKLFGKHCLSV